jgi:hypothetical protein
VINGTIVRLTIPALSHGVAYTINVLQQSDRLIPSFTTLSCTYPDSG